MSKIIVKTTGPFLYMDSNVEQTVEAHRPTVVSPTSFIDDKVREKKITVLSEGLPDTANDEDFLKTYVASDRNEKLAVKAYIAELKTGGKGETGYTDEKGNPVELTQKQKEEFDRQAAEEAARIEKEEQDAIEFAKLVEAEEAANKAKAKEEAKAKTKETK